MKAIAEAYELHDLEVSPSVLLLDPKNPRIVLETREEMEFSLTELAKKDVQKYILSVIDKEQYHVSELIKGIGRDGYLPQGNDMIVEKVVGTGKYLVLEGNRRLTAIKHLLEQPATLQGSVSRTLRKIKVKEFVFTGGDGISRDQVVFKLLGLIHISGPLGWGAMEKANYVHQSYTFELQNLGRQSAVMYDMECGRRVSITFNMGPKEVQNSIAIYRVFQQLVQNGHDVRQDDYSLIELAVKTRGLNESFFELDSRTLIFSKRGLNHFANLCVGEKCPIKNPGDFKDFAFIYREGTECERDLAERGDEPLERIVERLSRRVKKKHFVEQLEVIRDDIEALFIADYSGTTAEIGAIENIRDLVDRKLWCLISGRDGRRNVRSNRESIGRGVSSKRVHPKNIDDALSLSLENLSVPIKEVMRGRPNRSCIRTKLPTYLLRKWKIRSRAEPRQQFCRLVELAVGQLVADGILRAYKATNERLRLE